MASIVYIRIINKTNQPIVLDTYTLKPMGITDIEKKNVTEYMYRRLDALKKLNRVFYETIRVEKRAHVDEEIAREIENVPETKKKGKKKTDEDN